MAKIIDIDGKEREECVGCGRGMWFDGSTSDNYCPICSGKFTKEHYDSLMKAGIDIDGKVDRTCPHCGRDLWVNGMGGPKYCPVCSGKFTKEAYDRMTPNEEEEK